MKWRKLKLFAPTPAHVSVAGVYFDYNLMSSPGSPTEDSWPGVTSNDNFLSYNFPHYDGEPLITHAPRCVRLYICASVLSDNIFVGKISSTLRKSWDPCAENTV